MKVPVILLLLLLGFYLLRRSAVPINVRTSRRKSRQSGSFNCILESQISTKAKDIFLLRSVPRLLKKVDLPEEYDLRETFPDAMSSVLDQEQCGSCWAFATASALSDRVRMVAPFHLADTIDLKDKEIKNQLSPYMLASCDFCALSTEEKAYLANAEELKANGRCNVKCDGGIIPYALIYLQENGIISIGCNDKDTKGHYICHSIQNQNQKTVDTNPNHPCHIFKFGPATTISLYSDEELSNDKEREQNEGAIMTEIFLNGSVITGYMIHENFSSFFEKNPNGVYKDLEGTKAEGGHAVVIVGWGVDNNLESQIKYWICRNSWGKDWGDKGYFKILRGSNFCQIESGVYAANPDKNWLDYAEEFERQQKIVPKLR